MTDPRIAQLRTERQKERSSLIWYNVREALTGRANAASTDNPTTGLAAGYIWVHGDDNRPEVPALNPGKVSARVSNARVLIGERWKDGQLEVITVEALLNSIAYGGAIGAIATPDVPKELQPFGDKLGEFMPTVDPVLGGLYLYVNPGNYNGQWWVGGRILMAPTATSSKHSYYVVGFDEVTGALVGARTADRSLAIDPLPRGDIATTWGAGTFGNARPIGGVELTNGDTSFAAADILDLRDFVAVGNETLDTLATATAAPGGTLTLLAGSVDIANDSAYNAFPGACVLANGTIMVVYRTATGHSLSKGTIVKRTSTDGGATWSSAATVYSDATYDVRDPSITRLTVGAAAGTLIVPFFKENQADDSLFADGVYVTRSTDSGSTWGTPIQMDSAFTDWLGVSGPVVELPDGTLLLALYGENTGDTYSSATVLRSSDAGLTWGSEVTVATGSTFSYQEPNLVRLHSGRILCLLRTSADTFYVSHSDDEGTSWSVAASAFSASGSPRVLQTASGLLITVYRDASTLDAYYRTSRTNGDSWSDAATLEGTIAQMDYAALVEYEEGVVGVAYGVQVSSSNADVRWKRLYLTLESGQLVSNVPVGTAPLAVTSTTVVPNLNADMLDGYHAADLIALTTFPELLVDEDGSILLDDDNDVIYES